MTRVKMLVMPALVALAIPLSADAGSLLRGRLTSSSYSTNSAPAATTTAATTTATPVATAPAAVAVAPGAAVAANGPGCANGDCGGKHGGKFGGKFANHPVPFDSHAKTGLGLFQPPFRASPWYLYWPYDAHFQLPAPIGSPFLAPYTATSQWNPYFAPAGPGAPPPIGPGGPPIAPIPR